jgi:hypothetical protein
VCFSYEASVGATDRETLAADEDRGRGLTSPGSRIAKAKRVRHVERFVSTGAHTRWESRGLHPLCDWEEIP